MTFVSETHEMMDRPFPHGDEQGRAPRRWFLIALLCFAIAASIGALLRLIYVVEMPWLLFKPWLHAHSHVAMLGWLFPGLLIALCGQDERALRPGFWKWMTASQICVLAMLVSFPMQGYGAVSISFSALQVLIGYALVAMVWKATTHWPARGSRLLARLALVFQAVSTIGIWAMGPIMASKLAGSEWYYWSIQWFLHFQFNGWFWFAVMAIGSRWAEQVGVEVRLDALTITLWAVSTVLTFALAVAWSERHWPVYAVNSAGVLLQFIAAWRTLTLLRRAGVQLRANTTPWMRGLIGVALLAMAFKVMAQAAVAVPAVADMALTLRNYVIGFIHMNTLGAATAILLAFALMRRWLHEHDRAARWALVLFVAGFMLSELLLFAQGTMFWAGWGMMPGYYWTLFGASVLLPLSAWMLIGAALTTSRRTA